MNKNTFDILYFSLEIKGLISIGYFKKMRFICENSTYFIEFEDGIHEYSSLEFLSLNGKLEYLNSKFMWKETKQTVDGIIYYNGKIVLINRKYAPLGWAFPGGMIDPGESAEAAFVREMKEELSVDIDNYSFFCDFYTKEPRGPVKTSIFVAEITNQPVADDDALEIKLIDIKDYKSVDFAFKHHESILEDYLIDIS